MPQSKKEVVETKSTLPAATSQESWEGLGAETAEADDFLMPFVQIAQALSPQIDSSESSYIDGLQQGMFFNTATGEVYGKEITVVPTKFERKWLEFKLREEGGGLVEIHDNYDEKGLTTRDSINRSINDAGNQIIDSRSFYCLVKNADDFFEPAIISMKGTQGKKARQWLTLMTGMKWKTKDGRSFTAPLFSHTYILTTAKEKNDKGSWHGYVISKGDPMMPTDGDERFDAAHAFYKQLSDGGVKVDYNANETPEKVVDKEEDALEM